MLKRSVFVAVGAPLQKDIATLWNMSIMKQPPSAGIRHWYYELRRGFQQIDMNMANLNNDQLVNLCSHMTIYGVVLVHLFNVVMDTRDPKHSRRAYDLCDSILDGVEELQLVIDDDKNY